LKSRELSEEVRVHPHYFKLEIKAEILDLNNSFCQHGAISLENQANQENKGGANFWKRVVVKKFQR
jgi:hypothetical protein